MNTQIIPDQSAATVQRMFSSIASRYDRANNVLSFGMHHLWRRRMVRELQGRPSRALDLCTGTGDFLPLLAGRCESVVGADFCPDMLDIARQRIGDRFSNVTLEEGDALSLTFEDDSFQLLTVAFGVRNFEDLRTGLREMRRVLAPNGQLIIVEFGQPKGVIWGGLYRFYSRYCMPLIGGLVTGNKQAYTYLPQTSQQFPCGEDFLDVLQECGFEGAQMKSLTGGIAYGYVAYRPAG